jgi:hypothetical protein
MKTFHCTACQALVFFENSKCLTCGHVLAFSPTRMAMVALSQEHDGSWRPVGTEAPSKGGLVKDAGGSVQSDGPVTNEAYRLCDNYVGSGICNWAIARDDPATLCRSCGLTHTIPDQSVPGSPEAWIKLETAKRRLLYTVLSLELPLVSKVEDAQRGLEFRFLADSVTVNGDQSRVLTGHDNGVITINIAEADDVYREAQRLRQHEPYRTLLGHFRHETGHYYWDRLIANSDRLEEFRALFGDERQDYQLALKQHYERDDPPLGGLGRIMGPRDAYGRCARNSPCGRPVGQSRPTR